MIGPLRTMNAPHRTTLPTTMRRGEFWIVPEETEGGARGASHVRWGAPAELTSHVPVVLVHGGGGQSLDWSLTPDGRPGWAHMLIDAGHPVYLPDRPGHGRSAYDRAVHGDILARATPDDLQAVFAPGEDDPRFLRTPVGLGRVPSAIPSSIAWWPEPNPFSQTLRGAITSMAKC